MDPFSTYLWKRPNSWTSKIGKNVQKKCSISNWDEIVAELFRDDGALLSGDGLCVRGDDDRLHLDWSSWWWWLWGCSGKGGGKTKEDGDHVFTVFTRCRPPVPFLARTTLSLLEMYVCTWAGLNNKVTTRWEGPQSLSYHKQSLGTEKRWASVCTLMFNQILTSNQSYGDLPPLCVGPL